jgi:CheY-like chemotaxis protein
VNLLILVVDDEPDVEVLFRQQFRHDLRAGRFTMEFARSGDMALERIAVTLFNPKTVKANATYKFGENGLPPTGIAYVIVHGTIVVKESKVLPVKPGQPIRFPVEAKGRYQPVEVNKWLGAHTINVPDMHMLDDTGAAVEFKK